MRFDGVVYNFAAGIFVRLCPDGEAKFASPSQDAKRFRACSFGPRQMEQPKIHQGTIEARFCKRQLLCIAFAKSDFRKHASRDRSHFSGKIDADRICPSFLIAADTYPGPHATSNSVDQMKNELPRQ